MTTTDPNDPEEQEKDMANLETLVEQLSGLTVLEAAELSRFVLDLADGVVWVPANSFGRGVLADLASPGSRVTVKGADQ